MLKRTFVLVISRLNIQLTNSGFSHLVPMETADKEKAVELATAVIKKYYDKDESGSKEVVDFDACIKYFREEGRAVVLHQTYNLLEAIVEDKGRFFIHDRHVTPLYLDLDGKDKFLVSRDQETSKQVEICS